MRCAGVFFEYLTLIHLHRYPRLRPHFILLFLHNLSRYRNAGSRLRGVLSADGRLDSDVLLIHMSLPMSLPSLLVFYRRHEIIIFHAFADQMHYRILDYCTVQVTPVYCAVLYGVLHIRH